MPKFFRTWLAVKEPGVVHRGTVSGRFVVLVAVDPAGKHKYTVEVAFRVYLFVPCFTGKITEIL